MRRQLDRAAMSILTGMLLFNLAVAVAAGSRWSWLAVAFVALVLALNLWWRDRAAK